MWVWECPCECVQVLLGAPNLEDPVRPDLIPAWNKDKENEQIDSTNVKTSESANLAKRPAAAFSRFPFSSP